MIDPARKVIFVHIQKTAGTSVTGAFGLDTENADKHLTAMQIRARVSREDWDGYFKFAFVRNPWDRLVSWWSMIDGWRPAFDSGQGLANPFFKFVLSRARTFDEWMEVINRYWSGAIQRGDIDYATPEGMVTWMTRNQIDYITDEQGRTIVDFVGRFERLDLDFEAISQRVLPGRALLPHHNPSKREKDYRTYYKAATSELVGRWFHRDVAAFGYKFDSEEGSQP